MQKNREVVHVHTLGQVEAWCRLGWHVIGHAWDNSGPFTILALGV